MKILIDMNLPPQWVDLFKQQGWQALHWSSVGDKHATDQFIMNWAKANSFVVFTHDLDFGAILAATQTKSPSVIQIRAQDIMPQSLGKRMIQILSQFESVLKNGALIIVDENSHRVRILPLQ
jgi:predicted nuclease of predicted toxin-antitoxin system